MLFPVYITDRTFLLELQWSRMFVLARCTIIIYGLKIAGRHKRYLMIYHDPVRLLTLRWDNNSSFVQYSGTGLVHTATKMR